MLTNVIIAALQTFSTYQVKQEPEVSVLLAEGMVIGGKVIEERERDN